MRINKFIAQATGLSRRAADQAIAEKRVTINDQPARMGANANEDDVVRLNGKQLRLPTAPQTILLNKPVGYVCSRNGQGSQTIYDLLPKDLHQLKPIGRLDKDSSGILVMTNDGDFSHQLAHPGFQKEKRYQVELNKPLHPADQAAIEQGIKLVDGLSALGLKIGKDAAHWQITMHEGRNRQIRRTFEAKGYRVTKLERTQFGPYQLQQVGNTRFVHI